MGQQEKILALMIKRKNEQDWFYAPDFMKENLGELFVGYEASARMTELVKQYPHLFEVRQRGRYREIRLRFEDIDSIFKNSAPGLVALLDKLFLRYGISKAPVENEPKGLFD